MGGDPFTRVNNVIRGPLIDLSVTSLVFDLTSVGAASKKTFTITNPGHSSLSVTGITVGGADPSLFSVFPTTATIAAGGSQTITVTFAPASWGTKSATLSLFHNVIGIPSLLRVTIVGAGVTGSGALAADFDGNNVVDFSDFFAFASAFGQKVSGDNTKFDLDSNGVVDFSDFFTLAGAFGQKLQHDPNKIEDLEAAGDIIKYNQRDVISRWEMPIAVYASPSVNRTFVEEAIGYWQSVTGIAFSLLNTLPTSEEKPRISVNSRDKESMPDAAGMGGIGSTYFNKRPIAGTVTIRSDFASSNNPLERMLYRHEFGHVLGIFGHPDFNGIMGSGGDEGLVSLLDASQREIKMFKELYKLPHGTKVEPDGTWKVVR
jgi:hypothetical protein